MRFELRNVVAVGIISFVWLGCAGSAPATSAPPSVPAPSPPPVAAVGQPSGAPDACSEIAGSCHEHDAKSGGSPVIHACHELGHAHKLDACVARRQECLNACAGHVH